VSRRKEPGGLLEEGRLMKAVSAVKNATSEAQRVLAAMLTMTMTLTLTLSLVLLTGCSGEPVKVREAGAWPNVEYLLSLTDNPDQFMEALNISELTDVFNELKRGEERNFNSSGTIRNSSLSDDGSAYLAFTLDISDLDAYSDGLHPLMEVGIKDFKSIDYFRFIMQQSFSQRIDITGDLNTLTRAQMASLITDTDIGNTIIETIQRHGAEFENAHRYASPLIKRLLYNPEELFDNIGLDPAALEGVEEYSGLASWSKAYLLGVGGYLAKAIEAGDLLSTGAYYDIRPGVIYAMKANAPTGTDGAVEVYIGEDTAFHFVSTIDEYYEQEVMLDISNHDFFEIRYPARVDGETAEEVVRASASRSGQEDAEITKAIWTFSEGRLNASTAGNQNTSSLSPETTTEKSVSFEGYDPIVGAWEIGSGYDYGALRFFIEPTGYFVQQRNNGVQGQVELQAVQDGYEGTWEYVEGGNSINGFVYHYVANFFGPNNEGVLTYYIELIDNNTIRGLLKGSESPLIFTHKEEKYFGNYYMPGSSGLAYLSIVGQRWTMGSIAIADGVMIGGGFIDRGTVYIDDHSSGIDGLDSPEQGTILIISPTDDGVRLVLERYGKGSSVDPSGDYYSDPYYALSLIE
jgi:hypothetical protein